MALDKLKALRSKVGNQGFNWTAVLVWGGLIGIGVFALWYYKVEPVYGWMVSVGATISSAIAGLTGGLDLSVENIGNTILEAIKANPLIAITAIISITGGALALYERSQRIKETNLKLAAQEAEEYANIQKSAVTDDLAYYKTKAENYETELVSMKETNTAQLYETAKTELLQEQTKVQTLEKQLEEARKTIANTPVKIVKQIK